MATVFYQNATLNGDVAVTGNIKSSAPAFAYGYWTPGSPALYQASATNPLNVICNQGDVTLQNSFNQPGNPSNSFTAPYAADFIFEIASTWGNSSNAVAYLVYALSNAISSNFQLGLQSAYGVAVSNLRVTKSLAKNEIITFYSQGSINNYYASQLIVYVTASQRRI